MQRPIITPEPSPVDRQLARVAAAYDEVAERYDGAYQHPKDHAENRFIRRQLNGYLDGNVLDVGCGTGFLLDQFPELAPPKYVGVDISAGMLRQAAKKHPRYTFVNASIEDSVLVGEAFDSVVSLFGAFNYCARPLAAVSEIHRLLTPGGRVMLLVYGPQHPKRPSYVVQSHPPHQLYTALQISSLVGQFFTDVQVVGMSRVTDYLPRWLPQWLFNAVIQLEGATAARRNPDAFFFQFVTARKSAKVYPLTQGDPTGRWLSNYPKKR